MLRSVVMHRDDSGAGVGQAAVTLAPVAAAGAGVFIVGSVVVGVFRWFGDVYRGLATVARGTGTDEMAALERRMAMADVVVIAVLADARVDHAEEAVLRELASDDEALAAELRDAFARWPLESPVFKSPEARVGALRAAASKLGDDEREALRDVLAKLPAPAPTVAANASSPYRVDGDVDTPATLREELIVALQSSATLRA